MDIIESDILSESVQDKKDKTSIQVTARYSHSPFISIRFRLECRQCDQKKIAKCL